MLDLGFDGVISNSNDLAAHLVLVLPFVLYFALKAGQNNFLRLILFGAIFYGLRVILRTSSRGAFLGMIAMAIYFMVRASGVQRIAVLVSLPILAGLLFAVLPQANLNRLIRMIRDPASPPVLRMKPRNRPHRANIC